MNPLRPPSGFPAALAALVWLVAACTSGGASGPTVQEASARPSTSTVPSAGPSASAATPSAAVAPSPAATPSGATCSSGDPVDCLAAAIDAAGRDGRFDGVVLVAHDGIEIWSGAYGQATGQEAYGDDTPFEIHSLTKMVTAVAIAQLVAAGRLGFDDRLDRYLDGQPADRGDATIEQLLTHTAGLDGARGSFAYSNTGYVLLGRIIEAVTGETYQDYVDAHVFTPAGMTSTGADEQPGEAPASASGQRSTANDLLRFSNALSRGDLVDPAMLDLMWTEKVELTDLEAYGYGFMIVGSDTQPRTVGHFGSDGDEPKAGLVMNPSLGETIVILDTYGFFDIEPAIRRYATAKGAPYWPA